MGFVFLYIGVDTAKRYLIYNVSIDVDDWPVECVVIRVFRLEPDIAILYRFVLQNVKTKYYPIPGGNRTQAPRFQVQHAPPTLTGHLLVRLKL